MKVYLCESSGHHLGRVDTGALAQSDPDGVNDDVLAGHSGGGRRAGRVTAGISGTVGDCRAIGGGGGSGSGGNDMSGAVSTRPATADPAAALGANRFSPATKQ
jgi:hypothetical protein